MVAADARPQKTFLSLHEGKAVVDVAKVTGEASVEDVAVAKATDAIKKPCRGMKKYLCLKSRFQRHNRD